ncbi:hypothetical protein AGMMS50218_07090 [Actinomycetota bacterium]|nr:hypothetical protein AGMMS50218_07090 [Actinomycetota bacterium]
MEPDWSAVHLGTYPIAWYQAGDEWLYRFGVALAETSPVVAVSGSKFDSTTGHFVEVSLTIDGIPSDSRVLVGPTHDSAVVLIAGPREPEASLAEQVARSARLATEGMGDIGPEFEWAAVIGHPGDRVGGMEKRLTAPGSVGPLMIASSGVAYESPGREQPSMSSWSVHRSTPMIVSGRSRGYSWQAASLTAARDLRTLCGLLSIAWDCDLEVLEGAAPLEWGARHVPARPPWFSAPVGVVEPTRDEHPGDPVTVPEWTEGAWGRAAANARLTSAIDAYLEGAYAAQRHPSLAVVAYIASIETIADLRFKRSTCAECGSGDIARSFRTIIREVLDETEAAQLDTVYTARSKTVHAGRLHGGETLPGVFQVGFWSNRETQDFRWRALWSLKRAARLVLERSVAADLPRRVPLPGLPTAGT